MIVLVICLLTLLTCNGNQTDFFVDQMARKVNNDMLLTNEELEQLNTIKQTTENAFIATLCGEIEIANKDFALQTLEKFLLQGSRGEPFSQDQLDTITCLCSLPDPEIQAKCRLLPTKETVVPISGVEKTSTPSKPTLKPQDDFKKYQKYILSLPQWTPSQDDQKLYQTDPIPSQVNLLDAYGYQIYPPDMDYLKKINEEVFRKHPNRKRDYDRLIKDNACPGGDLRDLQFKGRWFYKKDPKTGKYTPADLRCADLTNANFDNARLAGADFRGAICNNTTFNYAAISAANFAGAKFIANDPIDLSIKYNANEENRFDRDQFSYTTGMRCIFDDCDMRDVSFSLANMVGSSFKRANLEGTAFIFFTDLSNCTFKDAKNFIENRWEKPHVYLSTNTTIESTRQKRPRKRFGAGTTADGLGYIVCDCFVKFYNTVFPNGKRFPEGYENFTPGLGTSDIFRNIKTVETP